MLTRLLLAATAGGSGVIAPPAIDAVTVAPNGSWTQVSDPHAVYHVGYVYVAYQNGSSGVLLVTAYHVSTGTSTTAASLRTFTPDTHTAPSLLVRDSDHKLIVAYSDHDGAQMYLRISANSLDSDPTISGGWASEQTLDASLGATNYTYPTLVQLLGETNDPIYLFYRDHPGSTGAIAFGKSTDGGATWGAQMIAYQDTNHVAYFVVESDGDTKIHIATSDGHPSDRGSVYHFYYDGAWKTSAGGSITLPATRSTATRIYNDATDGAAWPSSIALDGGNPVVTYEVLGVSDNSYRYAKWSGAAWTSHTITSSGGVIEDVAAAHVALDRENPGTVWASIKVGSHWEIQRWTTTDSGVSWTFAAVTSGSSIDNILPANIRDHTNAFTLVWLAGTYTTYLATDLAVMIGRSSAPGVPPGSGPDFTGWVGSTLNAAWTPVYGPGDPGFGLDSNFGDPGMAQVSVAGGILSITAQKSGSVWNSACIGTKDTYSFLYGTMECEINYPQGMGVWPAFWMLQAASTSTPPEVDVLEAYPGANALGTPGANFISSTLHWGGAPHTIAYDTGSDNTDEWHTYRLVWAAGSLKFYFDGALYLTVSSDVPTVPMYPILNLALGASGYRTDGTTPSTLVMQARNMTVREA